MIAVIDDPDIDIIYNPLPNGLHFEWTLKALAKGKHVLLEKPATSNTEEAEILFHSPLLSQPNAPVLMEAFHNRFTPAFQLFRSLCDPPNVSHALAELLVPSSAFADDDIRYQYDLAGGALMDLGTYTMAAVRGAFDADPIECIEVDLKKAPEPRDKCDQKYHAKLRFPNGGIGEIRGSLKEPLTALSLPTITVTHNPVTVTDYGEGEDKETKITTTRKLKFVNYMLPPHYHRIEIIDERTESKASSSFIKTTSKKETKKAYTFKEMDVDQPGEIYWSTYRYMLEQFVNQVKGRETKGFSAPHKDSLAQAKALDAVYEKSDLELRPTSKFRLETA